MFGRGDHDIRFDAAETSRFRGHPSSMHNLTRPQTAVSWVLQALVAGILLQTLFFKFTGAEESVYIFSSVGRFIGVPAVEPWGRIGSGVIELIASILLLVPATASLGAILTIGVMSGAVASHLVILGIEVKGDGGLLFGLAIAALTGSAIVLVLRRKQISAIGRFLRSIRGLLPPGEPA
jgi:putative oxidoreductase